MTKRLNQDHCSELAMDDVTTKHHQQQQQKPKNKFETGLHGQRHSEKMFIVSKSLPTDHSDTENLANKQFIIFP